MINIINLKRVADLGSEFITLAEAKTQLRVTHSDDDTEILALIPKARRHVENYCQISIVYQRVELIAVLDGEWKLPYGPVIGIESVQDSTNPQGSGPVQYTSSTSDWRIDGDSFIPQVNCLRYKITYTAGNSCPDDLKDVILQVITFLYDNRGKDFSTESLNKVLKNADAYKVMLWP